MGCPAEVFIGDNLVFSICTHDPDTGILTDADAAPEYRIYEDEDEPPILTGTMNLRDSVNTTGFYTKLIACTALNGFENGKNYSIYITATVDGDTGGICFAFKATNHTNSAEVAVSALMAATGITAGGTWTYQKLLKTLAAWSLGLARDKVGFPGVQEILDPDDGATVIAEVTMSETTPYRQVTIL